ncbi:hypothetical protein ACQ5SO_14345 [Rhodovulum sp. DZ06]|uniref:hypothetical protein n=1 Tax=Rhodovulum sp. DZ06 TaxID=3425126 RepID=UPI003D340E9C
MSTLRLASTRTSDVRPLGTAGQRAFELIDREAEALGPDVRALFAEPFHAPAGDSVDWYADLRGTAVRLVDAPPEQQEAGRAKLADLVQRVTAQADALAKHADPERRRLGEALRNAVEVPDEGSVYLVGEQPVLVNWAHEANVAAPARGVLTGRFAAPPPPAPPPPPEPVAPPPPPPPPPPRTFGWLWYALWGLVGALALAIAWLLVPACGIAGAGVLDFCPKPREVVVDDRGDALRAELALLERRLHEQDALCRPEELVCAPPPARTTVLLDASSSMNFGVKTPAEVERELAAIVARRKPDGSWGSEEDGRRYSELVRGALAQDMGRKRIEALREAMGGAFERADPLRVRLAPFSACGQLQMGAEVTDPAAARAAVDGMELNSFTALAYAIGAAAADMEGGLGPDDPATLVIVSDGMDTCGGDPCAAARSAKAARPGLKIHVVDLAGLSELQCVTEATGGTYFDASGDRIDVDALARILSEAAAAERPEICTPVPRQELLPHTPPTRGDRAEAPGPRDEFDRRLDEAGVDPEDDSKLKITLTWDTASDLDLWVTCPNGEDIGFKARPNSCGGELTVDRNSTVANVVERPVEHVMFHGEPQQGRYKVKVENYNKRAPGDDLFRVRISKGAQAEMRQGSLPRDKAVAEFEFNYP